MRQSTKTDKRCCKAAQWSKEFPYSINFNCDAWQTGFYFKHYSCAEAHVEKMARRDCEEWEEWTLRNGVPCLPQARNWYSIRKY